MPDPESSTSIIKLLFDLSTAYLGLFDKLVSSTSGSIEKRQRAGKIMIQAYESERILLRDEFRVRFASLACMRDKSHHMLGDNRVLISHLNRTKSQEPRIRSR